MSRHKGEAFLFFLQFCKMFKSRYKTNTLQRLIVKIKTKAWNLYWEEMAAISLSQFFVCVMLVWH